MQHQKNPKRTPLYCPKCGRGHVLDAKSVAEASRVVLYGPDDANLADLFVKCPACKEQIGLSYSV